LVFLTLIHFFPLIFVNNIFQCVVDKSQKSIPFFPTHFFFIWFSKIGDSLLVANRRLRPICQVTKVPFRRRNAEIILCWIFCSYMYINFNCGRTAPPSPNLVIFSHKKSMKHVASLVLSHENGVCEGKSDKYFVVTAFPTLVCNFSWNLSYFETPNHETVFLKNL
jgi:hypothetical protein